MKESFVSEMDWLKGLKKASEIIQKVKKASMHFKYCKKWYKKLGGNLQGCDWFHDKAEKNKNWKEGDGRNLGKV